MIHNQSNLQIEKNGKIEYENVNVKKREGKVRKVSKEYPEGLRRLATRMNFGRVSAAVKVISHTQKNGIVSMGFGSLLNIDMDNTSGLLNYYLLDYYDPQSTRLFLEKFVITINKEMVHDMLGFVESTLSGTNQINVVNKLVLVKEFSKIDWCKDILDCLLNRKQLWRRDDKTCYYSGPILILTLVYVYNMKFSNVKIMKRVLFVRHVTGDVLEKIEKLEINMGGFGRKL
ncbi:unnamed protein product [Lactuca saligna]|uniref:Uncharacterized protein n=1 Tax=Lactuca saligna TaxID=75948 RepID=A0AA35ZB70_LACSI|nr:unnamed protein product [Lactuca saligna]